MATVRTETPAQIRHELQSLETNIHYAVLNVMAQQDLVERLKAARRESYLAERVLANVKELLTLHLTAFERHKMQIRAAAARAYRAAGATRGGIAVNLEHMAR
jgi:hypothetical protein